jgi:hypothetical protein
MIRIIGLQVRALPGVQNKLQSRFASDFEPQKNQRFLECILVSSSFFEFRIARF